MAGSTIVPVDMAGGWLAVLDRLNPHKQGFLVVLLLDGGPNRPDISAFLLRRCDKNIVVPSHLQVHSPGAPVQSLRQTSRPASTKTRSSRLTDPAESAGYARLKEGSTACNEPTSNATSHISASRNVALGTFRRALATCCADASTPTTSFPSAARSRATGMPAPQPRSRTRPLTAGKPANDASHPFLTDRHNAEPFEIDVCDFVVARDDNAFRIGGRTGDISRPAVDRRV
jgi:hypothetical protein